MQGLENDLVFLQASVPELEKYLLSDVLYYPVTAEKGRQLSGDTTQLTIGNLLLSAARLGAAPLPEPETDRFVELEQEINRIRSRWRTNWQKKVEKEIPNRMRLWKNYLNEWRDSSQTGAGDFRYNVRLRVILELLMEETDDLLVQEKKLLRSLDLRLKGKGRPGNFIWDEHIAAAFPPDQFWFLYLQF